MKKKFILPLFLLCQILFLQLLPFFSDAVEKHYSTTLYPKIAKFSRFILGWIPFSVGDCLYFLVFLLIIRWLWKSRKNWKSNWKNYILQMLSAISVVYFLFYFLWACNYFRVPLFEKMHIQREYSEKDLVLFTEKLISKTNSIHYKITQNKKLAVTFPFSKNETFLLTQNGYNRLSQQYPFFTYSNTSIKNSLFSLPLTYMGFGGYLNPFTNEAEINGLMPDYNLPFTSCHEMAHQMGYASESECNFISFLATTRNQNLYFQYSGYSYALRYCLGILHYQNEVLFKKIIKKVHPGILKNYQESEDFWAQYETPIETGFKYFYDNFLKINQQKDGLDSYSKFVDLMVNYYKTQPL
ncbi:DUF3810 domain-containing protein [Flavobacterium agrisoli]|uniref:DUF3810 domain-containing protein n=1 Tax=Flavobacterium agrisoli TaxID=2793066 RepID=A0A934PK93_9FLAO|nr:DUF3810 domain-containing protein [Flavobacterium agrisoli]MBK0369142.1 DUF3810 domain-containing protein [Flavobacterium agrisoli]